MLPPRNILVTMWHKLSPDARPSRFLLAPTPSPLSLKGTLCVPLLYSPMTLFRYPPLYLGEVALALTSWSTRRSVSFLARTHSQLPFASLLIFPALLSISHSSYATHVPLCSRMTLLKWHKLLPVGCPGERFLILTPSLPSLSSLDLPSSAQVSSCSFHLHLLK